MNISNHALLDSNILVYAADKNSPFYKYSKDLRNKGITGEIKLCICPQVLTEFFAIVTDSKRVQNPISPKEAIKEIEKYLAVSNILIIYPNQESFQKLIELVKKYKIRKQKIFDLQIIATMLSNGIHKIYTFNTAHFSKIKEIKVLKPN